MAKLKVGDVVTCDLSASHGGEPDTGVVIGHTFDNVCVVASLNAVGMPINEAHCTRIAESLEEGSAYRKRYIARFPGFLLSETN